MRSKLIYNDYNIFFIVNKVNIIDLKLLVLMEK